jgi:hypothetical protein
MHRNVLYAESDVVMFSLDQEEYCEGILLTWFRSPCISVRIGCRDHPAQQPFPVYQTRLSQACARLTWIQVVLPR